MTEARSWDEYNITVFEVLALRDALKFPKQKGFSRISVEGDSKLIIDAMECRYGVPWRIQDR